MEKEKVYYLQTTGDDSTRRRVRVEEFVSAERRAGFNHKDAIPGQESTPATGGFANGIVTGIVRLEEVSSASPLERVISIGEIADWQFLWIRLDLEDCIKAKNLAGTEDMSTIDRQIYTLNLLVSRIESIISDLDRMTGGQHLYLSRELRKTPRYLKCKETILLCQERIAVSAARAAGQSALSRMRLRNEKETYCFVGDAGQDVKVKIIREETEED